MKVRIYPKSKTQTQSGQAGTGVWVLETERSSAQTPDPIMGWTQSGDTLNQIKMEFDSAKKAELFAKSQGWMYTISKPNSRQIDPRSYSDNFVCDMVEK